MKNFIVTDLSGRGVVSTLNQSHIEKYWDLDEEDDNTEQTLGEFLNEAYTGDTWNTNNTKITCL
jgi:hypothetical protein